MLLRRRSLVKFGFGLTTLPLMHACKTANHGAGSDVLSASFAAGTTSSDAFVNNSRYNGLPVTVSNLAMTSSFDTDAELVRSQLESVLNSHQYTKIRVRGGGHSYIGASVARNAYIMNMAPLNRVEIDTQNTIVRVGTGCRLYDVNSRLAAASGDFYIPSGDCPSVGVAGYHLAGGISMLSPLLGLGLDRVVSATIILVQQNGSQFTAQTMTISPTQSPDLFWAVMGSGGYYGLVTDLSLKFAQIDGHTVYNLYGNSNQSSSFRTLFRDWQALCSGSFDDATSSKLQMNNHGSISIQGIASDASGDISKMQSLANNHGASFASHPLTMNNMSIQLAGCHALADCLTTAPTIAPDYFVAKSTLLPSNWTITDQYLDWIQGRVKQNNVASNAYIQMSRWSGAMKTANPAVCFAHRDNCFEVQIQANTNSSSTFANQQHFGQWVDEVTWFLGHARRRSV